MYSRSTMNPSHSIKFRSFNPRHTCANLWHSHSHYLFMYETKREFILFAICFFFFLYRSISLNWIMYHVIYFLHNKFNNALACTVKSNLNATTLLEHSNFSVGSFLSKSFLVLFDWHCSLFKQKNGKRTHTQPWIQIWKLYKYGSVFFQTRL